MHSELLKQDVLKDFYELWPQKFSNKTNGVTPRRWLLLANPPLASLITQAIGSDWITDLSQLKRLKPLANDAHFLDLFAQVKLESKRQCAEWLKSKFGVSVDAASIFD